MLQYIKLVLCYFTVLSNRKAKIPYPRAKQFSPIQSEQIPKKNRIIFNSTNQIFSQMCIFITTKVKVVCLEVYSYANSC